MIIEVTAYSGIGREMIKRSQLTRREAENIIPVLTAIHNFKPYLRKGRVNGRNYPTSIQIRGSEKSAEELYGKIDGFKLFDNFVPLGPVGIHTIKTVNIYTVVDGVKESYYGPHQMQSIGSFKWTTHTRNYYI